MTCIGKFDRDFRIVARSRTGGLEEFRHGWMWPHGKYVTVYMDYANGNGATMPWRYRRAHYIQKFMLVPSCVFTHEEWRAYHDLHK